MMAGLQLTKSDFDSRIGSHALQVLQALQQWSALKTKIDAMNDADLTAMGYSTGDITTIRALMTDVGRMLAIFSGNANLPTAYDFRTNLRNVAGFGY